MWHSVFHAHTMTAQIISWKLGKHLLFQLTQVSIFHCFKFICWPTFSGTEEQVIQQQCPTFLPMQFAPRILSPFHTSLHDLGTIKHFCLCLLTTSEITIIVSFVLENVLLLWNEWQTVWTSWSPTGSWNLK